MLEVVPSQQTRSKQTLKQERKQLRHAEMLLQGKENVPLSFFTLFVECP